MKFSSMFEWLLVAGVIITGLIWIWDRFKPLVSRWRTLTSYFSILLSVLAIRMLVFQPFHVVSGSLEPSIAMGDVLAVNPSAFGVYLPLSHRKIFSTGLPEVGDIAVFYFPDDPTKVYVKRVIGTPGDRISYHNKILTINGHVANQTPITQSSITLEKRQENLGGLIHDIYINPRIAFNDEFDIDVPAGQYFMMGDNRDDSDDSRRWGYVPEHNLIGRVYGKLINWKRV